MFKLFKRKKEDKEIIVDEQGNEVEVQDEIEQPKEEPKETVKPEGETIEEVTTDPVSEEPVVEQIPQNPVENEEVTALKIELEAMKAEIEALKKAQEVTAPSQDEWGITQEPHFNGSEPNKQPRF
jgi:hypothetical protein